MLTCTKCYIKRLQHHRTIYKIGNRNYHLRTHKKKNVIVILKNCLQRCTIYWRIMIEWLLHVPSIPVVSFGKNPGLCRKWQSMYSRSFNTGGKQNGSALNFLGVSLLYRLSSGPIRSQLMIMYVAHVHPRLILIFSWRVRVWVREFMSCRYYLIDKMKVSYAVIIANGTDGSTYKFTSQLILYHNHEKNCTHRVYEMWNRL